MRSPFSEIETDYIHDDGAFAWCGNSSHHIIIIYIICHACESFASFEIMYRYTSHFKRNETSVDIIELARFKRKGFSTGVSKSKPIRP